MTDSNVDDRQPTTVLARQAIKKALKEVEWWKLVHDEVKKALHLIIEHIDTLGTPFRDSFRAACQLEAIRRVILQQSGDDSPSIVFGSKLPEEKYQSSKAPVKLLLGLNDWFDPNEADVQSCYLICDHVNILERLDVIEGQDKSGPNEE
jgi:hypothetical protein